MEVAPPLFPDYLDADVVQQRDAQGVDPLLAVEGPEKVNEDFARRSPARTTPTVKRNLLPDDLPQPLPR